MCSTYCFCISAEPLIVKSPRHLFCYSVSNTLCGSIQDSAWNCHRLQWRESSELKGPKGSGQHAGLQEHLVNPNTFAKCPTSQKSRIIKEGNYKSTINYNHLGPVRNAESGHRILSCKSLGSEAEILQNLASLVPCPALIWGMCPVIL